MRYEGKGISIILCTKKAASEVFDQYRLTKHIRRDGKPRNLTNFMIEFLALNDKVDYELRDVQSFFAEQVIRAEFCGIPPSIAFTM